MESNILCFIDSIMPIETLANSLSHSLIFNRFSFNTTHRRVLHYPSVKETTSTKSRHIFYFYKNNVLSKFIKYKMGTTFLWSTI